MPVARAVSAKFKAFSFPALKVIPLFRIPFFRYSVFSSIQLLQTSCGYKSFSLVLETNWVRQPEKQVPNV